jgi:serine/threonine-protein kinase RsbW
MAAKIFPGRFASLAAIAEYIKSEAEAAGLNEKEIYSVQLAVDEACTNIVEHAYGGEGLGDIEIDCAAASDGLEITIQDNGKQFDPDSLPEPKVGAPLDEIGPRGAGVFLMRKLMDEVNFEFKSGRGTTLRMKKKKSG